NRQEASKRAWTYFVDAISKKPWQAIWFKLSVYDMLWFGLPSCPYIYAACVLSTMTFFLFLVRNRFRFSPDLWLIPLYLLCVSPLIHYEHRYSQPFFLAITPITAVYTLVLSAPVLRRCGRKSAKVH